MPRLGGGGYPLTVYDFQKEHDGRHRLLGQFLGHLPNFGHQLIERSRLGLDRQPLGLAEPYLGLAVVGCEETDHNGYNVPRVGGVSRWGPGKATLPRRGVRLEKGEARRQREQRWA